MKKTFLIALLLFGWTTGISSQGKTDRYALIICGSGGQEEYARKFTAWGKRLQKVMIEKLGCAESNVYLLMSHPDPNREPVIMADRQHIEEVFHQLQQALQPESELLIFLIGHGSFLHGQSWFHIPGKDITAQDVQHFLAPIPAETQVVINAASSSAGFINVLSTQNRIVCTATKSADEKNATEFMEFFLQGIETESADFNLDQRITLLEACRYAAFQALAWYKGQGWIATEHALLDDQGKGLGIRLVDPDEEIPEASSMIRPASGSSGSRAHQFILKNYSFPPTASPDQIDAYLNLLHDIEELKSKKQTMEEQQYYRNLEKLFIQAATIHRDILQSATRE